MYVELKQNVSEIKRQVKSYIFFLVMRFFFMFIIAVCVLLFLIKLRWLKNRSIYDKVNPWTKIEPPTPKNPMPILVETCKLKTNKDKAFGC